jgi:hypothetical protein
MTNDRQPVMVENQALTALRFYHENYDQLFLRSVSPGNNALVLGEKPFKCRFCDGEPPARTFKMRAHALPLCEDGPCSRHRQSQGAYLVTLHRADTRRAVLRPPDV